MKIPGDRTTVPRHFWLAVAAILLLALALRLPGIATRSLWIDELYTEWFAARSFTDLWTDVPTYETHPPFYYSLLRLWTLLFGSSELGLRSLSLLFSLGTVFALAVGGRVLAAGKGHWLGVAGAALLALNYANIRDAQNARPYAMQTFVCTVAVLAAVLLVRRLLDSENQRYARSWIGPAVILGVSAGIGLWIHNTGFFIAFGLWLGLAATLIVTPPTLRLRNLVIFVGAGVLALLVWAPYLPIFIDQSRRFMGLAFWLTPKARDLWSAWMLLLGPNPFIVFLALALTLAGTAGLFRSRPGVAILVAIILIVPLYLMLAVSFTVKPIYIQRLFAWMVPLAMVMMAAGVALVPGGRWVRWPLAAVLVVISGAQTWYDFQRPIDDWKSIVERIAREAEPGDVVIAVPAEGSIAVDYYAKRQSFFPPVVCVPGCYPQRNLPRTYMSNLGAPRIVEADGAIVDEALRHYKRVWLVQVSVALYDPTSIVRSRIAAERHFVGYSGNSLAKVELFE
jgi:uncharacterized membrane protein